VFIVLSNYYIDMAAILQRQDLFIAGQGASR
jgi:hypothetical protein